MNVVVESIPIAIFMVIGHLVNHIDDFEVTSVPKGLTEAMSLKCMVHKFFVESIFVNVPQLLASDFSGIQIDCNTVDGVV